MKKTLLAILLILNLILFVSCSFASKTQKTNAAIEDQKKQENNVNNNNTNNYNNETKELSNKDNITIKQEHKNPIESIDLSINPNEMGEIMILMYHGIGDKESDWQRTPENFRKDLEYMYKNNYRMISLNDYARGNINTKAGYTPIILTFDDGRKNNFNYINIDGENKIDPDCAVGILEEFKNKYPDFNVTASFMLGSNYFEQKEYAKEKLVWLIENGYSIGNHTYNHYRLNDLNKTEITREIGIVNKNLSEFIPDYQIETLALPHGSNPKPENKESILSGNFEGTNYKMIATLDVGWRPSYSPFDKNLDLSSLYRVTASEINVGGCGIYDYFKQFSENKRQKFISDGNPDIVTLPKNYENKVNIEMVKNKTLNIYESN